MQRIPEAPYKWKEWEIPTVEGNQCLLQICFGNHLRQNCPSNVRCNCNSIHHHKMLCDAKPRSDYPNEEEVKGDKKGAYVA